MDMKHHVGTLKDSELKKSVRKKMPPIGNKHTSKKAYKRKNKNKNEEQ